MPLGLIGAEPPPLLRNLALNKGGGLRGSGIFGRILSKIPQKFFACGAFATDFPFEDIICAQ